MWKLRDQQRYVGVCLCVFFPFDCVCVFCVCLVGVGVFSCFVLFCVVFVFV